MPARGTARKKKTGKPKAASQRRPDIEKAIAPYIASLVRLYKSTDPAAGRRSEREKIERARQAVSIWWYLYAELMLWAQSHLAGYEFGRSNPDLIDRISEEFDEEITRDSHVLEYIGLQWSWNHVNYDDPMSERVQQVLESNEGTGLDEVAVRRLIRELLMSRSANSSFWRFELQSALFNLNIGHVDDLVAPAQIRRQGHAAELYHWKTCALRHVYFHVGKGLKKYRALELVSDAIGQSVETLRSWEKAIAKEDDDDFTMEANYAILEGQFEVELDGRNSVAAIAKEYGAAYHRHSSDFEYAQVMLKNIRSTSLEDIRIGLRTARTKKSGV